MAIRNKVGTCHLDVARIGVEMFYKFRQKSPEGRGDRYILMSCDEPPNNIKSAWKENYCTFMSELRNLKPTGTTTIPKALYRSLELLNINRAKSGVDNYGMGRLPFLLEPAIIIVITDWTSPDLAQTNKIVNLSFNKIPGSELTIEPYRWDQRIFIFILNFPPYDTPNESIGPAPENASQLCEITGGRALRVFSQKGFLQSLELLAQTPSIGVNIHFQAYTSENEAIEGQVPAWASLINFVNVPRPQNKMFEGNWPIPEPFWIDPGLLTLPPRNAFPVLKFSMTDTDLPFLNDNIPVDIYELEPSPLTRYLLKLKKPEKCWPVFVPGSGQVRKQTPPCGFLRTNSALNVIYLVLTPFNYPECFPLFEDLLGERGKSKVPELMAYLGKVPFYYAASFRRILGKYCLSLPDNLETNFMSHSLTNSLRRIKSMAKAEFDNTANGLEIRRRNPKKILKRLLTNKRDFINGYIDIYRIRPGKIITDLPRLKSNLLSVFAGKTSIVDNELKHLVPVPQMGNYQAHVKVQPLREVDPQPPRLHPFGNPFKLNNNLIDEADESMAGVIGEMKSVRRRSGPLPRDFKISVPYRSSSCTSSVVTNDSESVADLESLVHDEPVKKAENAWVPDHEFLEHVESCCERIRLSISSISDVEDTVSVVCQVSTDYNNICFLLGYAREIAIEKKNNELCRCIDKLLVYC